VQEEFISNDEFIVTRGSEFFRGGELNFPNDDPSVDKRFRTNFKGASFDTKLYGNSNHNQRMGIRRLTAVRKPELPGFHRQLQENQLKFVKEMLDQGILRVFKDAYEDYFEDFIDAETEADIHHADPHPKRIPRINAWKQLNDSGERFSYNSLWVQSIAWKAKFEQAKPNKKMRMIMDLGVSASLRGAWLFNAIKKAQDQEQITLFGGTFEFCKSPALGRMHDVFDRLAQPSGKFHFVYFSDDAALAVRIRDRVQWFNLDISSCDASHGPAIFDVLRYLVPERVSFDLERLISQCSSELIITSVSDPNHIVGLKPKYPKLYSGSTITTGINNVANILIGLSIAIALSEPSAQLTQELIETAANRAGYIVTGGSPLRSFEKLQFLKHSPMLDIAGCYRPVLNFGVVIRSTGSLVGDLPGSGPLQPRADTFQRSVLRGMYPKTRFSFVEEMGAACTTNVQLTPGQTVQLAALVTNLTSFKVEFDEYPTTTIPDSSFATRYDLTDLELLELHDYAQLPYSYFLNNSAISKVLELDYGHKTIDYSEAEYSNGFRCSSAG
jgi:hypothetical protein